MNLSLSGIKSFANTVESGFDVAGYIPGVSTLSGPLRATIGKVMVVVGLLLWAGSSFILECMQKLKPDMLQDYRDSLRGISVVGENLMKNGAANYVRGWVESLGLLGNALVLGYDYFADKHAGHKFVDYNFPGECQMRPVFNQERIDHVVTFIRETVRTLQRDSASNSRATSPNAERSAVGVGADVSSGAPSSNVEPSALGVGVASNSRAFSPVGAYGNAYRDSTPSEFYAASGGRGFDSPSQFPHGAASAYRGQSGYPFGDRR